MSNWIKMVMTLAIVVGLGFMAQKSEAAITLTITDGINPVIISDNGPLDSNPLLGLVVYNGPVGASWRVNVTTGLSIPPFPGVLGPGVIQYVDLNSFDATASPKALPLTIDLVTDPLLAGPDPFVLQSTIGGTFTNATTLHPTQIISWENGFAVADHGIIHNSPYAGTAFASGIWNAPVNFQIDEHVLITPDQALGTVISFDLTSQIAIPEPITVIIWSLLSLTCGGFGLHFWRRNTRPGVYSSARTPWSNEARMTIHKIIQRGRVG